MDKKIAGLLGTVAAAALTNPASAAVPAVHGGSASPQASSYAELLDPVPDAVAALQADDAQRAGAPQVELVGWRHHHHHHHHRYRVLRRLIVPLVRGHHHHHHHHSHYRRWDRR